MSRCERSKQRGRNPGDHLELQRRRKPELGADERRARRRLAREQHADAGFTLAGIALPTGFALEQSDHFGTAAGQTVQTFSDLHAKYGDGVYWTRDLATNLIRTPNIVVNNQQETYGHFEDAVVFSSDHLTIQARGHADGSITSAEMASNFPPRSFCIETRYKVPATDKAWPAFWWYAKDCNGDASEIHIEQPNTPNQGVHDVTFYNHTCLYDLIDLGTPDFTTPGMT